jgi:hypothetical protein
VRAGSLRYHGEIQTIPVIRSPTGAVINGPPQTYAVVSFEIQTPSGMERLVAATMQAELNHIICCRYVAGTLPTMQFVGKSGPYAGRSFDIQSIDESQRNKGEMTLHCKEFKTGATP